MSDTLTGRTIGKYKLLEKLGRGGMAEVYKGYQESLDRYVAIKLMHTFLVSEQDFLQRFKREAKTMAALRHPNIVAIYDFDVYRDDMYYLVMEYVSGGTLKEKLEELAANQAPLPLERATQIALQVAEALDYAHSRGMIHRDVKPANIMLNEEGRAILTDFGIVKLVGGQTMGYTATGALIGTPSYMSPEQAMGKAGDERVDIYALGVLLFQMTTGQLPFSADTPLAVIMQHVSSPVPEPVMFNPDVPPALQAIILRAMAKEPDDRYQNATDVAQDLRALRFAPGAQTAVFGMAAASVAPAEPPTQTVALPSEPAAPAAPPTEIGVALTAVTSSPPLPPAPTALPTEVAPNLVSVPLPGGATAVAPAAKKRLPWLFVGLVVLLLVVIGGGLFALSGRGGGEALAIVGAGVESATETATAVASPTETSAAVVVVDPAEAATAVEATPTNTATATPSATATTTPTATPTPDSTAEFLATCTRDVTLVNTFTYQNERFKSAPVNATFPVNWVLENSGTCPWTADLAWAHQAGDDFGFSDPPIPLTVEILPGERITLTTNLVAPATVGSYESVWSLVDAAGAFFGPELTFALEAYVPATATPAATSTPTITPTPEATPTSEQPTTLIWVVQSCEYIGTEWRCQVQITPYGGGGGPYTIWVYDADQPAEYRGVGQFYHFAKARRCAAYNHEVRVQDDATGTTQSQQIYIDPNDHFSGGCTLP